MSLNKTGSGISQNWFGADSWNPTSWKTMIHLRWIVNIMVTDVHSTDSQGMSKLSNLLYKRTKFPNLNVSRLVFQSSLHNPLKPGFKLRMKKQLEQRWQAMLQLHLSDQQFYIGYQGATYIRGLTVLWFQHQND